MHRSIGKVQAHTISPGGRPALRVELDIEMIPDPGQPFFAFLPGSGEPLRTTLYPSRIHTDGFTSTNIPSPAWKVGSSIDLRGPIGRGFSPPRLSRRWLLMAIGRPIDRLLPLIDAALSRDVSIAVWADRSLPELPAQVEIATSTMEVLRWADYLAVDMQPQAEGQTTQWLTSEADRIPALDIEILFDLNFACGLGVCHVCALLERNHWKLACQDGPVFHASRWVW